MEGIFPKGTGGFLQPEKVIQQFFLQAGMKVAHFGCGHGYFTIPVARIIGAAGKVYAIDVQNEALEAAQTQAKINNLSNIEFIRANLEVTGSSLLDNNSMDLVLLVNVLFQSQKKEKIIREAKRVLKDNGHIIIIDWDPAKSHFGHQESGWRLPSEEMKKIAEKEGLVFEKDLDTGFFHYGFIINK